MIALWLSLAGAQEVSGFVEVRASAVIGADGTPWQLVERFRPTFDAPLSDRVAIGVTVEAALAQGRNTDTVVRQLIEDSALQPLLDLAGCDWTEAENKTFRIDRARDYLFVDRLYVDWYHPDFDLRVGRQALQWGSALFVNPTDPFPQVLFTEPWRPRAGVNSARITIPMGDLHRIQGVIGTNDALTSVRIAARGTVNWKQTDWSLVGAWRQESDEVLAGIDIKGTAGVGFWVEGALRVSDIGADATLSEQVAVGVDYSFPVADALIVAAQYLRNGGGGHADPVASFAAPDNLDCPEGTPFADAAPPDPFAPFLTGTDYGLLSASLAAGDVAVSAAWLQNLGDGSGLVVPSVGFRAPAQIDVSLSAQIPVATWGNGELKPASQDLVLEVPGTADPVDFSGLLPDANVFVWTRFNY